MKIDIEAEVRKIIEKNLSFSGKHIEGNLIEIEALWDGVWFGEFTIQLENMRT